MSHYGTSGLAEKYSEEDDVPLKASYNGFQLLKVWPRTDEDVDDIKMLGEQPRVQIWLPVLKNASTDIIIPPDSLPTVKEDLKERGVEFSIINHNIEVSLQYFVGKFHLHTYAGCFIA